MKRIFTLFTLLSLLLPAAAIDIVVNNTTRNYLVYAPQNLGDNRPLLISCHGMNQDAAYQKGQLKIESIADTAKFVTVFPNGIDKRWDISGSTDIDFVLALIDKMAEQYHIDRNRVYLSGFSMGGMFTYHAMNNIADRIAAFAPISGYSMGGTTANSSVRPIPIIHTHGTGDDVVQFSGVQGALNAWINHNGCPTTATTVQNYKGYQHATRHTWGPGNDGVEVVLLEFAGKGHWISNDGVLTGEEIWNFCKRYSLHLTKPTVKIPAPTGNPTYITLGGTSAIEPITVEATASDPDGQVSKVAFHDGEQLLGECFQAPYSYTINSLAKGQHQIRAIVTDDEGNTASSQLTISVVEPEGAYPMHQTFTVENSVPEGWLTYDGKERRVGFASGYSLGCRVFRFTGAQHDFNYGLYARNVDGKSREGYARFAAKETTTLLTLYPGEYELSHRLVNWNTPSFSPITIAIETADGQTVKEEVVTPTANVGNAANKSFSGSTSGSFKFNITEKGRYVVTFYTVDANYGDLVVGEAALKFVSSQTGVNTLKNEAHVRTYYYDMSGRRIDKPSTGLYIMQQILPDGSQVTRKYLH